jgi:phosphatidylserine/phosphatidylglycerophosphate/cardiolipin synthase-like enzyme
MGSKSALVVAALLLSSSWGSLGCEAPLPTNQAPPDDDDGGGNQVGDLAPPSSTNRACEPLSPRSAPVEIAALPEAGEAPYVDVLNRATRTIRVFSYLMGYGGVLDALTAKAKAGVDVRVILDVGQDANKKYADMLTAAGASVRWSDPQFPYMHAKVIVADDVEAAVSTGNYSKTYSIDRERNFVAHLRDREDIDDLVALFDADWDRRAPDLACTRLLVSPVNAKARLLAFIAGAQRTLTVESMQLADDDVRAAIVARKQAGVDVRALLAAPSWIDANTAAATVLKSAGIPARWMARPGVHTKALAADGARAYVGSVNLSWTSLTKNREVGVVTDDDDAVRVVNDTFEKDWATATPF